MSSRTRYALVVLSALGLAASLAALYVHYRLITEPGYTSFCDVNETVSCEQVFESRIRDRCRCAGRGRWRDLVRSRPDALRLGHAQAQVG